MKRFRRFPFAKSGDPQRATVLIVVLWASLGLVSVALLFGHSMLMAYRGSDNDLAGVQADQAIEGAARYAEAILATPDIPGVLPDITTYETEAVPVGDATFWFIGRPLDTTTDSKTRVYGLIDEASKLNLNTATNNMLMELPGMTDDLAAAIIDWRTSATGSATPSGTSSTSTTSSVNKQGPFESIEELALVDGATRDILFGEDANLNGVLEPNEDDSNANLPADNADGKLDPGILEYVTVFSRESNTQKDGTKRIDIKDPNSTLSTYLSTKFPSKSPTDIQQIIGAAIDPLTTSLLAFYVSCGTSLTEDGFGQIAYDLTTTSQQQLAIDGQKEYLTGLINVNTASETVLDTIFQPDQTATILSARLNRDPQPDDNYAWVATALGLQPGAAFPPGLDRLTGKTSQVTADIAAVGHYGRGYRRTKMVIDISSGTPQIIYRRNLAPLGWALGSDVRADLAAQKTTR